MSHINFGHRELDNTPSGVYAISRDGITRLADQGQPEVAPSQPSSPGEDNSPSALSAFPTPGALLRAFAQSWRVSLPIGLVLAVVLAGVVWTLRPNKEAAMSLLQMSLPDTLLPDSNARFSDLNSYTATQLELIKSSVVLRGALKDEKIRQLPVVARQLDPVEWLESEIKTELLPGTDIVRVSIAVRGDTTGLPELLNAVVQSYMSLVVEQELKVKKAQLNDLEIATGRAASSLGSLRESYQQLANSLKGGDAKILALKQQNLINEHAGLRRELGSAVSHRSELERKVTVLRSRLAPDPATGGISTSNLDPTVLLAIARDVEQDPKVAAAETEIENLRTKLRRLDEVSANGASSARADLMAQIEKSIKNLEQVKTDRREAVSKRYTAMTQVTLSSALREAELELNIVKKQIEALEADAGKAKAEVDNIGAISVDLETKQTEIERSEQFLKTLWQKKEMLNVEIKATNNKRVKVVFEATETRVLNKMRRLQESAGAGFAVLSLVVLLVSFREFRRGRIHTEDDVAKGLNLRVLGSLPNLPLGPSEGTGLVPATGLQSFVPRLFESADAIRALISQGRRGHSSTVIMVASANESEGKSTLAVQLAASFARGGFRTLLVDGDLRVPSLHEVLSETNTPGFCELLSNSVLVEDVVRSTGLPGVDLLPAGDFTLKTASYLGQTTLRDTIYQLRQLYSVVIIDSSPLLLIPDGLMLAATADEVILSVRPGTSQSANVHEVCELIRSHRLPLFGVVVNGVKISKHYNYGYAQPVPLEAPIVDLSVPQLQ